MYLPISVSEQLLFNHIFKYIFGVQILGIAIVPLFIEYYEK